MDPRRLLLSVLGDETDDEVVDYVIGSIEGTNEDSIHVLVELLTAHSMTDPSEESVRAVATQVAALVTAQPAAVAAAPLEPAAPPLAAPKQPTSRAVAAARPPGLPQQPRLPQQPDGRVDGSGGERLSPAAAPDADRGGASSRAARRRRARCNGNGNSVDTVHGACWQEQKIVKHRRHRGGTQTGDLHT